jgi:hypothetical protein
MRNVIAWTAMMLGIVSLITVLKAGEPAKPITVNPTLAMHLAR